jgi:hypothetical protein
MKPIGNFGAILHFSNIKAQGRPFSFIMQQEKYTMLHASIVPAGHVKIEQYTDWACCVADIVHGVYHN